jgi:hypothetical protein
MRADIAARPNVDVTGPTTTSLVDKNVTVVIGDV